MTTEDDYDPDGRAAKPWPGLNEFVAQLPLEIDKSLNAIGAQLLIFARTVQSLTETMKPGINAIAATMLQVAESLPKLLATLPPNVLALGKEMEFERFVELSFAEGLQFAYVPPTSVIRKMMSAPDAAGRRRVLRNNGRSILRACDRELDLVANLELREFVQFAQKAALALRDGHRDASQALSANLLDTLLALKLGKLKRLVTNQKARPDLEELSIRATLTLSGIWAAHGQFFPDNGDQVPRIYSRHGSVHGVSRRQFTEVNATLALMHVVAFLRLIDSQPDFSAEELERLTSPETKWA